MCVCVCVYARACVCVFAARSLLPALLHVPVAVSVGATCAC